MESRFIDLTTVSEILAISMDQTYALVRSQQLRAIKIGGRGVYRVERTELEAFIQRSYDETQRLLGERPTADSPTDARIDARMDAHTDQPPDPSREQPVAPPRSDASAIPPAPPAPANPRAAS